MSTVNLGDPSHTLPEPIVQTLRSVIRRARFIIAVRGVLGVVAVAIGMLLVLMAVDAGFTIFSFTTRLLLSLSFFTVVAAAAVVMLIRPLIHTMTLTGMARLLELRHPEMEERISSAVELLTSRDSTEMRGSDALIAQLASEATGQVTLVRPEREFNVSAAKPYIIASSIVGAILIGLLAVWPQQVTRLLTRAVVPTAALGNVFAERLEVTPGDAVVPAGESFSIQVRIQGEGVRHADLLIADESGREQTQAMALIPTTGVNQDRDDAGDETTQTKFAFSFPAVETSFRYRVYAAGALSRHYTVTVVPRPRIEGLTVAYDYPDYTQLADRKVTDAAGPIEAPIGTVLTIETRSPMPLAKARLLINSEPQADAAVRYDAGQTVCAWQLPLETSIEGMWTAELTDKHGFSNFPEPYPIRTIADRPPIIEITRPSEPKITARRTDRIPLSYIAQDDYGVGSLTLTVESQGKSLPAIPVALADDQTRRMINGLLMLDLADLPLAKASRIAVQLRGEDGRPDSLSGPQQSMSRRLVIELQDDAQSFIERQVAEDHEKLTQAIDRAIEQLEEAREQAEPLAKADANKPEASAQTEKIDQLREEIAKAEQQVHEAAEEAKGTAFNELAESIEETAEEQVKPARESADMMKLTESPDEQTGHAADAEQKLEQAIEQLKQAREEADRTREQIEQAEQMHSLAQQQEQLAEEAAQASEQNAEQQPESQWQQRQSEVAEQIGEMAQQDPEAAQAIAQQQQQLAQQLSEEARENASQQEQLQQATQQAEQAQSDPQASEEQQAQQAAEAAAKALSEMQRELAQEAGELAEQTQQAAKAAEQNAEQAQETAQQAQQQSEAQQQQQANAQEAAQQTQKAAEQAQQAQQAAQQSQQAASEAQQAAEAAAEKMEQAPMAQAAEAAEASAEELAEAAQQAAAEAQAQQQAAEAAQAAAEASEASSEAAEAQAQPTPAQQSQQAAQQASQQAAAASERAEQAEALAERQQQIAEAAKALAEGKAEQALQQLQETVAAEAEQIAAEASQLAEAANMSQAPQAAQEAAQEAASESAASAEQAAEAAQAMAQPSPSQPQPGQPQPGQPQPGEPAPSSPAQAAQQQASQSMTAAAEALERMSEALAQAATPTGEPSAMDPSLMAEAMQQSAEAAQAPSQQQAAQAAQAAAQAMSQMAQQMASQMPAMTPGQGSEMPSPLAQGAEGMYDRAAGTDPAALARMGLTADDWTRLPDNVKQQIADAAAERAPAEYRDLVRAYFQELARRGGQTGGTQ